jgi:hypothetical protein
MSIRHSTLREALALSALLAAGCASEQASEYPNTRGDIASVSSSSFGQAAVAAVASRVGISERYVGMALDASRNSFANSAQSIDDKERAAQQGASVAAQQAAADGQPMSTDQRNSLLQEIRNFL